MTGERGNAPRLPRFRGFFPLSLEGVSVAEGDTGANACVGRGAKRESPHRQERGRLLMQSRGVRPTDSDRQPGCRRVRVD